MVEKLGIEKDKIIELSNLCYKNYGTTMAGLKAIRYDFDNADYYSFVHGRLPYENLKPDPVLRGLLQSLPLRKLIFTNADGVHAAKVLNRLGLEDCFEGIICFETLNPTNKTNVTNDEDDVDFVGSKAAANGSPKFFDIIGHFSQPNPSVAFPKTPIVCKPSESFIQRVLEIANINLHKAVGTSQRVKGADCALESIHSIKEALPELWEVDKKS